MAEEPVHWSHTTHRTTQKQQGRAKEPTGQMKELMDPMTRTAAKD